MLKINELSGNVEKVLFHPPIHQGGLLNSLFLNKSPLGDLGVDSKRGTFSKAPIKRGEYRFNTVSKIPGIS
jgi:hypothetical protein